MAGFSAIPWPPPFEGTILQLASPLEIPREGSETAGALGSCMYGRLPSVHITMAIQCTKPREIRATEPQDPGLRVVNFFPAPCNRRRVGASIAQRALS
eukprot:scaffold1830_cov246-Pinguiococcus_pyrenoidosus.AAC.21